MEEAKNRIFLAIASFHVHQTAMIASIRICKTLALVALLLASANLSAYAADRDSIRIVAPLTGSNALIGREIAKGAQQAAPDVRLADTGCDAQKAAQATRAGLAEGVLLFVGYPCVEALDAAIAAVSGTPASIIALGVAVDGITVPAKDEPQQVFRLGARASDEIDTLARHLKTQWRDTNFAIIDDGTLYGRQIAEGARFALEADNLKPVFTDTYRPLLDNQVGLVRRLRNAGASHVLIGGDAFDASIIAKDAKLLGYRLQIAGGSAFVAPADDGALPDGTLLASSVLDDWQTMGAEAVRFALTATELAAVGGLSLADALAQTSTDTTAFMGGLRSDGELKDNPVVMFEIRDGRKVAISSPVERTVVGG